MQLLDYGNHLIKRDIKRLKRFKSLETDLKSYFTIHKNTLANSSKLSCEIFACSEYLVCKERIGITIPNTPPSKGGRLWFVILKKTGHYIRCLLYAANEEPKYPKSTCYKIVNSLTESLVSELSTK